MQTSRGKLKVGDRVFVTTFVKVYSGEIVAEDKSDNHLNSGDYYIVKLDVGGLNSVAADMLTLAPKQEVDKDNL